MNVSKLFKVGLALTAAALSLRALPAFAAEPAKAAPKEVPAAVQAAPVERIIQMAVTEKGYEPSPLTLKKGQPVKLLITRKTEKTCATDMVMKEYAIHTALPLNQEVAVAFTPSKSGTLKYGCAMGQMISGQFLVE